MTAYALMMAHHIKKNTASKKQTTLALLALVELHKPQEITLPNGDWGDNCSHCDGLKYPCKTIAVVSEVLQYG